MPAPMIAAAGIGAVGSLASGAMGAKAAGKASDAQVKAAEISAQVQRDAAVQARIDAYPWALTGAQALYSYMDELGIPRPQVPILPDLNSGPFAANGQGSAQSPTNALAGPTAGSQASAAPSLFASAPFKSRSRWEMQDSMQGRQQGQAPVAQPQAAPAPAAQPSVNSLAMTAKRGFQETPGYQFMVEEGERGVMNNLAAMGMKNSGSALKALTRFRTGLANQEYGTYLNRLAETAGMGQTQINRTNDLTQVAAGNIGRAHQDAGAARASGYVGAANSWQNAIGGAVNNISGGLGAMAFRGGFPAAPSGGLY